VNEPEFGKVEVPDTLVEGENEPEPGYDPKADARLQSHIANEQRRIDEYTKAMADAHNRKDKRAAKRHLRKRGKGFTK
jgi:hypothetical protein